jgi:hypothetical protein
VDANIPAVAEDAPNNPVAAPADSLPAAPAVDANNTPELDDAAIAEKRPPELDDAAVDAKRPPELGDVVCDAKRPPELDAADGEKRPLEPDDVAMDANMPAVVGDAPNNPPEVNEEDSLGLFSTLGVLDSNMVEPDNPCALVITSDSAPGYLAGLTPYFLHTFSYMVISCPAYFVLSCFKISSNFSGLCSW